VTLAGTSQYPIGLPGQGSHMLLDVQLGSWTMPGFTYMVKVAVSPGGYTERTAESGVCVVVAETRTSVQPTLSLESAPLLVRKATHTRGSFTISVQYATSLPTLAMFILVQNFVDPGRGYLIDAVLAGSGAALTTLPGVASNLTLEISLGSWVRSFTLPILCCMC
jgi:hypothetical protein